MANVHIKLGKNITTSNQQGYYRLDCAVPYNDNKISISYVGYQTIEQTIECNHSVKQNFYLVEKDNPLASVVITATRTQKRLSNSPVITQVITAKQIAERGVTDIRNLLMQEVPGLQFQEVGFGTSIDMQGMSGKHILFLIDGERMAGEIGNNIDYGRLILNDIEQIEIVQGASSSMYGSQAMGGVINIITKKNKKKIGLDIGFKYTERYEKNFKKTDRDEDNYRFQQGVDKPNTDSYINLGLKFGKIATQTNINYKTSDGYQLYDTDSLVKNFENIDTIIRNPRQKNPTSISGYENLQLSQKISYQPNKRLKTNIKGVFYNNNRYDFNPNYKYEQNQSLSLSGGIDYTINPLSNLRLSVNTDQYQRNVRYEFLPNRKDKFYLNGLIQSRLTYQLATQNHQIVSGVEQTIESLYGYQFSDNMFETKRQFSTTLFAQDDWQINPNINLIGGIRLDYNDNFGWNITPKLSALYKIFPFSIRFNYANGYRTPGLKDLYMNWDHLGMFRIYGNRDLKPETNHYVSLSGEYIHQKIYLNIMVYANQFRDKIEGEWRNNQKELHYVNMSSALLTGANINTRFNPIDNLYLYATANYLHPDRSNSIRLTTNSTWTGNARIEYNLTYGQQKTVLNLMGRYIGKKTFHVKEAIAYRQQKTTDYYLVTIPHYLVFDLSMTQYIGKKIRMTLGIDNLLDYKAGMISFNSYVSPGRKAFFALHFTL